MDQHFNPDHLNMLLAAYGVIIGIAMVVGLIIMAVICYLVSQIYEAIPEKHRTMIPGQVWLLMIPCFNLFWNFKVYPGLSQSFKSYFDSVGDTTVGDCSAQIALWYCITSVCCIIPCVNYIAGPAALVLFIIFLVKAFDLKAKIKA